jgi:O-glycosyl hydrolase
MWILLFGTPASEYENLERIENILVAGGQFTANLIEKSISTFVIALT